LFLLIIFSNVSAVGNQLFELVVSSQWILFLPTIAWGAYDTQLGTGKITSPSNKTCNKNISSLVPGPIITFSET
jgi:hypothetical protein